MYSNETFFRACSTQGNGLIQRNEEKVISRRLAADEGELELLVNHQNRPPFEFPSENYFPIRRNTNSDDNLFCSKPNDKAPRKSNMNEYGVVLHTAFENTFG